jgi:hypothetical protein
MKVRWLLVLLAVAPLLAGCEPVVEVHLVTGADRTATARAALPTIALTRTAVSPTATPTPTMTVTEAAATVAATASPTATALLPTTTPVQPTSTRPPTATPRPTATPEPVATRIRFQPGATSAARSSHLGSHQSHLYLLGAQGGQIMEVELVSTALTSLSIWGADGTVLKRYVDETPTWQGTLPATQDYYIQVITADEAADYGLRTTAYARIRFAPGATSATVSSPLERLGPGGVEMVGGYVVRALAGQTMTVSITSAGGDVLLTIVGADGVPLKRYVDGSSEWEGVLPTTQDYLLQAISAGGSTQFTLSVEISALP